MQPLNVAVIGTGNMGQHHARIYAELPHTQLVGVVDPDAERGQACAARFGTRWFADHRELPATVQAVSIVVPTRYHHAVALECLQRDWHVLVEKPIAVDVAEARELVEVARARSRVLQVGHLERFNPAVRELKRVVRRPLFIEAQRLTFPQRRNLDVGIVWDLMIHDLDILLDLVDAPVEEVSCLGTSLYSDHEDLATVRLRFAGGCIAHLVASRVSGERTRTLKVVEPVDGGVRTLHLDFIAQSLHEAVVEEGATTAASKFLPIEKEEPLRSQLEHFAGCVTTGQVPIVSGEAGLRALALALAAVDTMQVVDNKAFLGVTRSQAAGA